MNRYALLLVATVFLVGCEQGQVAVVPESEFLLKTAPEEAVSISEAKAALSERGPITVVGRINAGAHDAFEKGKAMFVIKTDAASTGDTHDHDAPGHDPDKCPFCKQKNNPTDSIAIVQFRDSEGNVIATDARDMLGVKKGQVVIVQGDAEVDPLGHVMINATGLFVKR